MFRPLILIGLTDWMHDTARCLGYPSDSTRAARERAPGDNLQSACGPSIRPGGSPLAPVAQPSPRWLYSRTPGRRRRIATSQWPWANSLGLLAGVPIILLYLLYLLLHYFNRHNCNNGDNVLKKY